MHYTCVDEGRWSNAAARYFRADSALGGAPGQGGREPEQRDEELRTVSYDGLSLAAGGQARRREGVASAPAPGPEREAHPGAEAQSAAVDQWQGSAAVWLRLRTVDATDCGGVDRTALRRQAGRDR